MKEQLKQILGQKITNSTDLEITTHEVLRLFHVLSSDFSWVGKEVEYDRENELGEHIVLSNHLFDNIDYYCPKCCIQFERMRVKKEYGEYIMLENKLIIKKAWAKIIA